MPLQIVRNDITNMQVDAIVNTTNSTAEIGYGVDTAIHNKAGKNLLKARKQLGSIELGHAAITEAYNLPAKYVIHTVCPIWKNGNHGEAKILSDCYQNALSLAWEENCKSIAFPLLSAGNLGFPKKIAMQVALNAINLFLMDHDMDVYLVIFSHDTVGLFEKLFSDIQSYIDETYVEQSIREEYALPSCAPISLDSLQEIEYRSMRESRRNEIPPMEAMSPRPLFPKAAPSVATSPYEDLEALLNDTDATFSETLLQLIKRSGKTNSEIYNRAHIDRKLFSKIKNNPYYTPKKGTVLSFAIALELNLEDAEMLLERAGYAFSHANKFDIIVEYFIKHKMYDIFLINDVLYEFDQPLLGQE